MHEHSCAAHSNHMVTVLIIYDNNTFGLCRVCLGTTKTTSDDWKVYLTKFPKKGKTKNQILVSNFTIMCICVTSRNVGGL